MYNYLLISSYLVFESTIHNMYNKIIIIDDVIDKITNQCSNLYIHNVQIC